MARMHRALCGVCHATCRVRRAMCDVRHVTCCERSRRVSCDSRSVRAALCQACSTLGFSKLA
eukprot:350678-Chlamydomonas_euryale.AAC.1